MAVSLTKPHQIGLFSAYLLFTIATSMTISYQTLRNWHFEPIEHSYKARDVILYSLGIGYGLDPLDPDDLPYVYEKDLRVPPTFAVVLGYPGFWARDPRTGTDWVKLLHGEQTITLHKSLPREGAIIGHSRISRLSDKGTGKGALLEVERTVTDKATGDLYATLRQLSFLRGDGGFSSTDGISDPPPQQEQPIPERQPDSVISLPHALKPR